MARIPKEEIERLKREVSLERLVERYGIELKQHGADLHGLCPFHEDKEPSLVISPDKNLWHCLGACQAGGSVIDWVMKAEGVSFPHAVELLRQDSPLASTEMRQVKRSTVRRMPLPFDANAEDQELLGQVIGFYHQTLKQNAAALSYLERRGICQEEAIERFKLGFANRHLGYRLPEKNRRAGALVRGRLQKLGIMRPSGHEHFAGSLVIPVLDENGRVLEVYGRKIAPDHELREEAPRHLYLPGPHRGVWNITALAASEEIILCEALIDALTFWCAGFRNVTSSYGVEGFTKEHLEALLHHGTKRVLIAYDRDEAGERAAASLAEELMRHGIECFRVQFPRGMDANEYALKLQPAARSLELVIRQALWLGKGAAPVRSFAAQAQAAGEKETPREEPVCSTAAAKELSPLAAPQESSTEPPAAVPSEEIDDAVLASPVPEMTPVVVQAEKVGDEVRIRLGDRFWRIRGLSRNPTEDLLKVNVLVARRQTGDAGAGQGYFVDTLDLYCARQRALYVKLAAEELEVEEKVIKRDLAKVLLKLEELQVAELAAAPSSAKPNAAPKMSEPERQAALALLEDPQLLARVLSDFERCGVVGEQSNKLVGYLAAVSRKLEEPLAVVIQSSSAAGKTSLMEAVLAFFPEEERVKYSAMTGQSLFYMGEHDLSHKILAIVEEEGAERASYALKLLQSERELTIASTGKDPTTGRLVTQEYRVEGPVMIFLTTTAVEIDEELQNRCVVLTVDEEREQTRAIHRSQRRQQTLEGLLARRDQRELLRLHQNAQRLLRPVLVANPFAEKLTFLDSRTRTRRDHMKYLTLIRAITLLHQYQRPLRSVVHGDERVPYIEVSLQDIEVANRLAHQVLGRSLDELAPQTRRLLELLDQMVRAACEQRGMERSDYRFSRREVREHTGWGPTQVRVHLERLVDLEYVLVHHGGRGQQFVYELLFDGSSSGAAQLAGLAEIETLRAEDRAATSTTANLAGPGGDLAGGWRGHGGPKTGGWRGGGNGKSASHVSAMSAASDKPGGNAHLESKPKSYTLHRRSDSQRRAVAGKARAN